MKIILSTIILCLLFLQFTSLAQPTKPVNTYRNPVIPGDIPDPTVIRVGKMYYAAGTTSDFAPNYPLYESADLVNWKQIGSVFNKTPSWASDSFWAPELYYNNGTFYVYYTAKRKGDRVSCIGVATTKDIHKGFTDHGIIIEWGKEAIDGFVFKDDDKKMYICWKAYGLTEGRPIEILASEMSADGLSLVGEHFSLTRYDQGWKGEGAEGECLVKHNGYYYLFYAVGGCCDNRCSYRVMVSRSKTLKSDWEQYSENPILQGSEVWKCPGHGTLVTTPDNRYFYMYHSYNATDFEYIGRQGMLDEVVWDIKTGWPRFKSGKTPSIQSAMPFKNTKQLRDSVYTDDFSTDRNLKFWQWDLNQPQPKIDIAKGTLRISPQTNGFTFLGLNAKTGTYILNTEVENIGSAIKGIGLYGNKKNILAFGINGSKAMLYQIRNGEKQLLSETSIPLSKRVFLKMESIKGRYFRFYWSIDETNWIPVKIQTGYSVDGNFLPQWGAAMRTGLIVDGNKDEASLFSSFRINYSFQNF